ncbi:MULTISPECIES: GNAT family N-acetyltransferase [Gordonia]|uniref:GNAT family N-acetyltransferase n=1 Tax=Gordonia TaxID=2053 RepID=UPI00257C661A|nr:MULTISPECIES: GNAT family N-acyltransferase [Gordonia]
MFTKRAPTRHAHVAGRSLRLAFIWGMTDVLDSPGVLHGRTLVDAGRLRIVLTESAELIDAVQRLRYDVFAAEPGFSDRIGDPTTRRDADHVDEFAEHLVAIDDEYGVLGCARLLAPPRAIAAGGWYSASEFDLTEINRIGGSVVEMGRACVAPGHRHGAITALLWAAVLRYLDDADYRYLMGCVSVPLSGPGDEQRGSTLRGVRDHVLTRHRAPWRTTPLHTPLIDGRILDEIEPPSTLTLPPLLRAYLRLGATVCGEPAVDEIFDVGDFVTIIDREHANTRYLDRLRATGARLAVSPRE